MRFTTAKLTRLGAAFAVCVALAACTKASESTGQGPVNAWTIPGVARVSVNTDVNTFNPVISSLYVENYIQEAVFSGLVKYDGGGKLIGDLALTVPSRTNGGISADGRTIVYHLRRNALWQDGVPVTSADVRFTYDTIMNPASNSPVQSTYARIAAIDTPDRYTVVFHLHAPFAPLLSNVFCNGAFGEIVPMHVLRGSRDINRDPFNAHPIGSGPYAMRRWERGTSIVLTANPRYFGGAPHIREIDILIVPNENTQLVMMESHQLDLATQARPLQIPSYRRISGASVAVAPTYAENFLSFNMTRAPLDDVVVRRALVMALDRPHIAATAYAGLATDAQTLIPPYSWAYDRHNGAPGFDPAAARRLLDGDDWKVGPDGFRTKAGRRLAIGLIHYNSATPATVASEIERAWRDIGVEVSIRAMPRNVVIGNVAPNGNFDVLEEGAGFDADPDRSQFTQTQFIGTHGFNYARYSSPDVDRWTDLALQTYDLQQRARFYALIQRRLNRDLPYVPIAWEQFAYAVNTDLRGFAPETINSDFWNVEDWAI